MRKISLYSNDDESTKLLINKLIDQGFIKENELSVKELTYNVYIPDKKLIVSHLCLEMHYPDYEENLTYVTDYINMAKGDKIIIIEDTEKFDKLNPKLSTFDKVLIYFNLKDAEFKRTRYANEYKYTEELEQFLITNNIAFRFYIIYN